MVGTEEFCAANWVGVGQAPARLVPAGSCGTAVKGGVGDDILLLGDAILAQGLQDVLLAEPCVEDAPASAQDVLGSCLGPSEAPRYAHTRRPIHVVLDVILGFKAQAIAERHVRTDLPVILDKRTGSQSSRHTREDSRPSAKTGSDRNCRSIHRWYCIPAGR